MTEPTPSPSSAAATTETSYRPGAQSLPPAPIAIPTQKSQEMVLVRRSEIYGLKRSAKRAFSEPATNASGWAYTWLGVGIAALLSLGALLGIKDQSVAPSVIAGNAVFIIVGFFLAVYCWWFDHQAHKNQASAEADFMAELDELDNRAPTTVSAD